MVHKFKLQIPDALWTDIADAATTKKHTITKEILTRLSAPESRTTSDFGHYEGTLPLEVLALRGDQAEDFGPMLEFWRAKRDVSRSWLAEQLMISNRTLSAWEGGFRQVPDHLRDRILDSLEWLDSQFPDLQYRAEINTVAELPGEFAKEKAELDAMDIETAIEWMNPGGWNQF